MEFFEPLEVVDVGLVIIRSVHAEELHPVVANQGGGGESTSSSSREAGAKPIRLLFDSRDFVSDGGTL